MGKGYLKVQTHAGEDALPVANAEVIIKDLAGNIIERLVTNSVGETPEVTLPAPDADHTLDPYDEGPYYTRYDVEVNMKMGFYKVLVHGVSIYDGVVSILPVEMHPLPLDVPSGIDEYFIPVPAIQTDAHKLMAAGTDEGIRQEPLVLRDVIIPDYITVHLGNPTSSAENVRVKFTDYIKNAASSEIYPTWPQSSLEANIYAIITFALNRVFTEWYPSRGYSFDITSSTAVDQAFVKGREIYSTISVIVDRIFNSFARRPGRLEPFFTQFCNGTTVTCPGLSQWGTVPLANQGLNSLAILRHYYPRDIQIVTSNNIKGITESYPGYALKEGDSNSNVRIMQEYLNRIRVNYPLINQIPNPNGYFDNNTKSAVKTFQTVFNLNSDGIIGRATWYKIVQIFVGITKLAALDSEGKIIGIGTTPPTVVLREGATGSAVLELQFLLNYLAPYYSSLIPVIQDNVFRASTTSSVKAFQRTFNLNSDGIVGPATWNKLYNVFRSVQANLPLPPGPVETIPAFPGTLLRLGSRGANVRLMQEALNVIRTSYPSIGHLATDGIFGPLTQASVREFQRLFNLGVDGIIGPITWGQIITQRNRILNQ